MNDMTLNAFLPFLATVLSAIITGIVQIIVEYMKSHPPSPVSDILRQVKWWMTIVIATVVAIVAIVLTFSTVSSSTHCAVTNSNWIPFNDDGLESTVAVKPVMSTDCAIQVSFDLKEHGWVAVYKKIEPNSLLRTVWAGGVAFSYSGMGKPNTLEIKLIDDTVHTAIWQNSTSTVDKVVRLVSYRELMGTGGSSLDLKKLDRIDFSFSNWPPNDMPGTGDVVIDDIRVVPSRLYWMVVFSPIIVIGFIVWLYIAKKRPM